jgi:hypothetical protein
LIGRGDFPAGRGIGFEKDSCFRKKVVRQRIKMFYEGDVK